MVQDSELNAIAKDVFGGLYSEAGITACMVPDMDLRIRFIRTPTSIVVDLSDYVEDWPADLARHVLTRLRGHILGTDRTTWTMEETLRFQAAMGPTAQGRWERRQGGLEWHEADGIKVAESPCLVCSVIFRRFGAPRAWLEDEETMTAVRAWFDSPGPVIPDYLRELFEEACCA